MKNQCGRPRDSRPGRRRAQFCKPKIRNIVAECVQYERAGNDWIVTEVMWVEEREDVESIWGSAVGSWHLAFGTQYSVLGTRHSALGIRAQALGGVK